MVDHNGDLRRIGGEQGVPVLENPAGTHDEEILFRLAVLPHHRQQSHDLVGLAQAHVVGQQRADAGEVATP